MPRQQKKSGFGGWLFLALTLLAYLLLSLINPEATTKSLSFFMQVMTQVFPMLGLVFLLLFIANLLLEPKWIKRYLGKGSGIKGWIAAIIGGILSLGAIYAWYAMLSELKQKGMRTALIATFLYSRAVKLPLLPLMVHYFGMAYTLILCLYLIIFSIINGFLVEKLAKQRTG
jgi:uncharacterized membrane protein YraQ (UPF0718 family)